MAGSNQKNISSQSLFVGHFAWAGYGMRRASQKWANARRSRAAAFPSTKDTLKVPNSSPIKTSLLSFRA
jgi:hypothetical protein